MNVVGVGLMWIATGYILLTTLWFDWLQVGVNIFNIFWVVLIVAIATTGLFIYEYYEKNIKQNKGYAEESK